MSNVNALIDQLQQEFDKLVTDSSTLNLELDELLIESIQQTMEEIKAGANSDYFHLIVLLNFIISTRDLPRDEVETFLKRLKMN
jgi:chaperonin cofactor prefoldin